MHPDSTSRLRGFYLFPDRDSADRAGPWGDNFRSEFLTEVEIGPHSSVAHYDAQWITHYLATGAGPWIEHYLSGEPQSSTPIWEWVVEGRASVGDDELRQRARESVVAEWPESRGLLALARLGVLFGSDLGLIAARSGRTPAGHSIEYGTNFQDALNGDLLERASEVSHVATPIPSPLQLSATWPPADSNSSNQTSHLETSLCPTHDPAGRGTSEGDHSPSNPTQASSDPGYAVMPRPYEPQYLASLPLPGRLVVPRGSLDERTWQP
jgi:hypothetical protein